MHMATVDVARRIMVPDCCGLGPGNVGGQGLATDFCSVLDAMDNVLNVSELACSSFPKSVRRRSSIWRFSSDAISTCTESFASWSLQQRYDRSCCGFRNPDNPRYSKHLRPFHCKQCRGTDITADQAQRQGLHESLRASW